MERDIDYVIAVAECGSISQAAEMLYISQPSLSRYLSSLENELGVNLFVRTINGTELTEAGTVYVAYAKEIKRLRSTMKVKLRELQQTRGKRIRIGMALNSISLSAFNVAKKVRDRFPDCQIELFNLMSKDIPDALRAGKYDFAIGPDLNWPAEISCEVFSRDSYILVVPDSYDMKPYEEQRPDLDFPMVDLRRLSHLDFVLQDESTAVRKGVEQICRRLGCKIQPKLVVTSSTIALQAVENQLGCCIVAAGHLAYLNNRAGLKFYHISDQDFSYVGVIRLRGRQLTKEETYCISCIKQAIQEGDRQLLARLRGV